MTKNTQVQDDAAQDTSVAPVQYDITSFGADYDVEGLVRRLDRNDILIPLFQRAYVWTIAEASRFVESLLLGLPVPGVFLAKDPESNKLLVIDGQQRLKSLQFFLNGYFNPQNDDSTRRIFKLTHVQPQFERRTYETLNEDDRRLLRDSIIHATIVKQEQPQDDDTSIVHIFERLNTSGRKLTAQQIRVAIYHGGFSDLIHELNDYKSWRIIYGKPSSTLKDQELILRCLAFYFRPEHYERPMAEFLNKFAIWGRRQEKSSNQFRSQCEDIFKGTIDVILGSIGPKAFRPERAINAAMFDSVMVGLARRLQHDPQYDKARLVEAYNGLLADPEYLRVISQSTSDEKYVETRLRIASNAFESI